MHLLDMTSIVMRSAEEFDRFSQKRSTVKSRL